MKAFLALALLTCVAAPRAQKLPPKDIASVPSVEHKAGGDKNKLYFLIGHDVKKKAPKAGYKLLLILPGAAGGRNFEAFCRRIRKYALGDEWLAVQLVAKRWTEKQGIVWPTDKNKVVKMKFSTEKFIEAVIADVEAKIDLDRKYLFTLSWSSSGPACYAEALRKKSRITGSFIAMSVFKPKYLPPLKNGKKRAFYIYHSKADKICPMWMAEEAVKKLEKAKAKVELATYDGGHGWRGPIWPNIKKGIAWLEKHHAKAAKLPKPRRGVKETKKVDKKR